MHDLNVTEGKVAMMYYGELPWHELGTELLKPATAQEAITAACLDYSVELRSIRTVDNILFDNKKATVRTDTNIPLGIVGNRYSILQNRDAFSFFDPIVGEGSAVYHTAGALGKGERIWILAKLPESIVVTDRDIVDKYLLLMNSHDGSSPVRAYFTNIRVVCSNTLTLSMKDSVDGIAIRHTGSTLDKLKEAHTLLGLATQYYSEKEHAFKAFIDRPMTAEELKMYFGMIFGAPKTTIAVNREKKLTELFETGKGNDLPKVRGSLWAAFNAVTEFVDHYKYIRNSDNDPSTRFESLVIGNGAYSKRMAFTAATKVLKN